MNFYLVSDQDGSSDDGYYEIIIQAKDVRAARKGARQHLLTEGREDLAGDVNTATVQEIAVADSGVLHSTVQS